MKTLKQDARGFVQGVVTQLKKSGKAVAVTSKVESLLLKMTTGARKQRQAIVESPVKLTANEEQSIEKFLAKVAGHDVILESRVEPSLIGGIRVTMADWVMDTSIKNELREMAMLLSP